MRRFIVGPVGSGKSVACAFEIIRRACQQKPNTANERKTRWAVIRNTYPELKLTTVKTWKDWFGSGFGSFNNAPPFEHKINFTLPDGTIVNAEVVFLALDREDDVKKLLSLEVTGVYFNEVREIPKAVVDAADSRIGRYPSKRDGGATWYGIFGDTNPPEEDHWFYDLAENQRPDNWEFFHQPGGVYRDGEKWKANPDAENLDNLPQGYYSDQVTGKTDDWIAVYLGGEYGHIPTEGSYYADLIAEAEREGRIGFFPPKSVEVYTFWDLGRSDDTTIWFGQEDAGGWRWIDYYEDNGKGLDHYATVLQSVREDRRLTYGGHFWPHDGNNGDIGIVGGKTRKEVMGELGFDITVLPRTEIQDGIDAARRLIKTSTFDKRCSEGVKKLRRYKRKFDDVRQVFLKIPLHDWTSHAADGFRTAAMGVDSAVTYDHGPVNINTKWIV